MHLGGGRPSGANPAGAKGMRGHAWDSRSCRSAAVSSAISRGRGATKEQRLASHGMVEGQFRGVQSWRAEAADHPKRFRVRRARQPAPGAVTPIPHQRMADARHVDPYLVGAPGFQNRLKEAVRAEALLDPHFGDRSATVRAHPLARAVSRMPADGLVDGAAGDHRAFGHAQIAPEQRPLGEGGDQAAAGRGGGGHQQQAGGVLVESMHDAGPGQRGERRTAMQQAVHQGAVPLPGARMHHHARRLVHHRKCSSSCTKAKPTGWGLAQSPANAANGAAPSARLKRSPPLSRLSGCTASPFSLSAPCRMQRFSAAREKPANRAAAARSTRSPANSGELRLPAEHPQPACNHQPRQFAWRRGASEVPGRRRSRGSRLAHRRTLHRCGMLLFADPKK